MKVNELINLLIAEVEASNYSGWDIFDGLNSKLFQKTPLYHSRIARLLWIQLFKISPINFRFLTMVPKGYNAKGLALLIRGYINMYKIFNKSEYLHKAYHLADIIISQRSKSRSYFCVGYNFHWEAKAFSVLPFTPNMIVSSFVAQAFLDLYEIDNKSCWLNYSLGIAHFIEKELLLDRRDNEICFGYIPDEPARVHNVNLMGSRLMARLFSITKKEEFRSYAKRAVNYSCNFQKQDGSWDYGEMAHHKWVDNFHTGFNLVAINEVQNFINTKKWMGNLKIGLDFHLKYHFQKDMTPKYFENKIYPIDIHNFSQGLETLFIFGYLDKAMLLLEKCIELMFDRNKHYFYYQQNKYFTNKNNYIRWGQSWMFYALSLLITTDKNNDLK